MKTTITKEVQTNTSPEEVLNILKEGNKRFLNQKGFERDFTAQVKQTAGGQSPLAVTLSCIDSRVPCEIIFDQGIGDIFSCRVAGNIINEDVLGSIEYSCKYAGSKLILVLGHTSCGAVKGACDQLEDGNLTALLSKLKPAVDAETETSGNRNSNNINFVNNVAKLNVKLVKEQLLKESPVLAELIKNNTVKLVGAMYHVDSGKVEFYKE
jgi:carbonic anhydrase